MPNMAIKRSSWPALPYRPYAGAFRSGIGSMHYRTFAIYNVTGAVTWVFLFVGGGYLFGNMPWVKNNFSHVTLGIIIFSLLPIFYETHLKAGWPNGKTSKGSGALCIILPATTQKAALLKYWKHWQQLILNRPAVTGSTHTVKQQPADQKECAAAISTYIYDRRYRKPT